MTSETKEAAEPALIPALALVGLRAGLAGASHGRLKPRGVEKAHLGPAQRLNVRPSNKTKRTSQNTSVARIKRRHFYSIIMIIKSKNTKTPILNEGNYAAAVASITGRPNDTEPKKVALGFTIENHDGEITKILPFSFENGTPLRKDVETLLGNQLTATEAEGGVDLATLIGKRCQVVVVHRAKAGGKPVAEVGIILPLAPVLPQQPLAD